MRRQQDIFSKTQRATIGDVPEEEASTKGAPLLVEYGILVGLISVVAIGAVVFLGQDVHQTLQTVSKVTQLR